MKKRDRDIFYEGTQTSALLHTLTHDHSSRRSLVRLADKPWQKVLLADLLSDKNTIEWLVDSVDKPKQTRLADNGLRTSYRMKLQKSSWTC
jgi:hypothetical protein